MRRSRLASSCSQGEASLSVGPVPKLIVILRSLPCRATVIWRRFFDTPADFDVALRRWLPANAQLEIIFFPLFMDNTLTALVIEDDTPMNASIVRALESAGFQTESAYDGEEGLEKLNKNTYSAVVLDLSMPVVDGYAVLARWKTIKNPETPSYVLTGTRFERVQLADELGATRSFDKSQCSPREVVDVILRDLEQKRPPASE